MIPNIKSVGSIGIRDFNDFPNDNTSIKVTVHNDPAGDPALASIRIVTSAGATIVTLDEDDLDAFRNLLFDATRELMVRRNRVERRKYKEERMLTELGSRSNVIPLHQNSKG